MHYPFKVLLAREKVVTMREANDRVFKVSKILTYITLGIVVCVPEIPRFEIATGEEKFFSMIGSLINLYLGVACKRPLRLLSYVELD